MTTWVEERQHERARLLAMRDLELQARHEIAAQPGLTLAEATRVADQRLMLASASYRAVMGART